MRNRYAARSSAFEHPCSAPNSLYASLVVSACSTTAVRLLLQDLWQPLLWAQECLACWHVAFMHAADKLRHSIPDGNAVQKQVGAQRRD